MYEVDEKLDYIWDNRGLVTILKPKVENYINKNIDELSEKMDKLLAGFSEVKLQCQGRFSNGEAVYKQVE